MIHTKVTLIALLLLLTAPSCKRSGSGEKTLTPGQLAAHCKQLDSWKSCAEDKRCEPVRFTHHEGYKGPAWACQPMPDGR